MISRKEHLEQINRFHNLVEQIDAKIKENPRDFESLKMYFELTSKVWPFVDDCIDEIKEKLDDLESKEQ